jgi:hypothetical protein
LVSLTSGNQLRLCMLISVWSFLLLLPLVIRLGNITDLLNWFWWLLNSA